MGVVALAVVAPACRSETTEAFDDVGSAAIADVERIERRPDRLFDVTCRDGRREIATEEEVVGNRICAPLASDPVVAVATGITHTCALTRGGSVKCWGRAVRNGAPIDTRSAAYLPNLGNVRAITAGALHTCALTAAGAVKCWGWNRYGALGDGTTADSAAPVAVAGLDSGVNAIAAGEGHTCAALANGTVKCWGRNWYGAIGDGTTIARLVPVEVSGLSSVTAIAAGAEHSCALAGSALKCWGDNRDGELGDGTTIARRAPVDVIGLPVTAKSITAGASKTCALTPAGRAWCWGVRPGLTASSVPIEQGLGSGVEMLSTGLTHLCAIVAGGGVRCWGGNAAGQLGDYSTTASYAAVHVRGLDAGVTAIDVGRDHTCAVIASGAVKCWGANRDGQLGDGSTDGSLVPVFVTGL
jgi:alpha-tubulin suppressor-like RCC1 family protein